MNYHYLKFHGTYDAEKYESELHLLLKMPITLHTFVMVKVYPEILASSLYNRYNPLLVQTTLLTSYAPPAMPSPCAWCGT